MPVESQADVVAFLTRALGERGHAVEMIRTHISIVLLGPDRVLKLKRAVRFPYLDFSSAERRLEACQAELDLNRRTAPSLYLGVRRITRGPNEGLAFDGAGPLADAVVEMRRFPQDDLFDAMAQSGRLTPALVADLAHRLAAFHGAATISRRHGGAAAMASLIDMNDRALRTVSLASAADIDALTACFRRALQKRSALLEARREAGKVRRCHGDLTLRNICLHDGVPTPFDCIEFDADLATIDVLYDLAFLLMDLWHRDRRDLANLVFNRYLDEADETGGIVLLPFFMAIRATIRAHVTATQAADAADAAATKAEARAYFDLARHLMTPSAPALVAVGGLSGSGKSTVALSLAPWLGAAPGARILSSDRVRKRLHGVSPLTRLPASAYEPTVSRSVYATLREEAEHVLAADYSAVVDAVFDRAEKRAEVEAVAQRGGIPFTGVWLEAPTATLTARIESRRNDPSDATPAVLAAQARRDCGTITWRRLDARLAPETLRGMILS